jgi:prevent-host-death family protein
MQSWQMQVAKEQFEELIKCAIHSGPQDITLNGRSVAVLMSRELFDSFSGNQQSLVDFMRASPLADHDEIEQVVPRILRLQPSGSVVS